MFRNGDRGTGSRKDGDIGRDRDGDGGVGEGIDEGREPLCEQSNLHLIRE